MSWKKTLCDADGDVNIAELIAAVGGAGGVFVPIWHSFHGAPFDIQSYGIGLGAIVGALGAAQRMRGDAEHH